MNEKIGSGGWAWTIAVVLFAAMATAQPAIAQGGVGMEPASDPVPGRVVVAARAGAGASEVDRVAKGIGASARAIGGSGLYVVELPPQASERAMVERLARNPHFKFAELDRRFKPAMTPNDTLFGSQWHTTKINAQGAWDIAQGDGVTIAILDSGVDGTHPDLSARMVPGWNVYNDNSNTADIHGHGTAVASAAAATLNNAAGYAAVAGRARIMPVRIVGSDLWAEASKVAAGITWAAEHGARVVNISYSNMAGNSTVLAAADYLRSKGGLLVVAAGNAGGEEGFGATSKLIPVSATDRNDALTSFSSWGSYVAIAAPGIDVPCTSVGGGYGWCWGTSLAAPVVAGTVAVMMSAKPTLSNTQIEGLLYSTAVDLGANGRDKQYGHGRVNAGAAVQAAAGYSAPIDSTPPTVSITSPVGGASVAGAVAVDANASDNVSVAKVELRVNGTVVATDTAVPYGFTWNSASVTNGSASVVAVAYDAAGNAASSSAVSVTVANGTAPPADTSPPSVTISNPAAGTLVASNWLTISASATDNAGVAGITQALYIDGALKATASGGSLAYRWNTRKLKSGLHSVSVVARDAAGNSSSAAVQVSR